MPYGHSKSRGLPTGRTLITPICCLTLSAASYGATGDQPTNNIEEVHVTGRYTTGEQLDTATGLGLTLYETPQSVSVVTAERIADQNLNSLTEVVHAAAGVSAKARDSSRYAFSSRGFGINNYQIDGIPVYWESGANAGETQSQTALYQRVEVVRGATGLLTGAGNPSASINLVRKHADSKELAGTVEVSAGQWDAYGLTADVGSALNGSGSIRGRVVGHYQDSDSFRDLAGDTTSVFYGVIDADLTDQTLLRIGASYQENEPTASTWGGLPVWHADGSRTDWDRSETTGADWTTWSSTVENYYLDFIHEFGDGWQAKLSVNHNVNASDQLLLYLSGTPDRETGLGMGASPRNAETEREQTSLSFHLSGQYSLFGREHDVTFGMVDHSEDNLASSLARDPDTIADVGNFNEWDGSYPQPVWGAAAVDTDLTTEQFGVYGATRLALTEQLKIILGGRVADWEQTGESYGAVRDYGDNDVVIPYAGALYEVSGQHTIYTSYAEIFQPQNLQDRHGNFLDPVIGKSYELGLKSLLLNSRLQSTVAAFYIQQDNLGQPDGNFPVPGIENSQAYYAAEGIESKGYELEIVGELMPRWNLSFSYTNFDAEDAEGQAVNTDQPNELLKLYTIYQFAGALADLTVAGGVNWQGSNYTNTSNPVTGAAERVEQQAYSLVSLMARYDITSSLSAQLNLDNVLDEEYYSQIGFYNQLEYGNPRNATLSVRYSF